MKTKRLDLKRLFILVIFMALLPQVIHAGLEWNPLRKLALAHKALDVTASFDGKLVFALTPGMILVYSADDDKFIDRIPVDSVYTRIAYSNERQLILSSASPATINIIKFDRVYDINIANRPFQGSRTPKVTLVVFDDYQ